MCFGKGQSRVGFAPMKVANILKLMLLAVPVAATALGGYLFLTKDEAAPMSSSVCPVTGSRADGVPPGATAAADEAKPVTPGEPAEKQSGME